MVDTRMFYFGGYASHGIGCIAPVSIQNATETLAFNRDAYITSLARKGSPTILSKEAEKLMQPYVLAAAIAINKSSGGKNV
ncbi:Uncharacterised protein [uncultured archaeon]|nr:Uncharacterised protein [uncultured archaeon]